MEKWVPASPDEPAAAVAGRAVAGRLAAVGAALKRVRQSPDAPEHVHKLRVWCRRADAALGLFAPVLPDRRARRLRARLRRLRRAAGRVRDLDVLAARLTAAGARPKKLRAQRARALGTLDRRTGRADGRRLKRLAARLLARVRPGDVPFGAFARDRLRLVAAEFFAADPAPHATPADLHAFRNRGKAVRYALELVAAVLPPAVREEAYPVLGGVQDVLGTVNDLATFRDFVQRRADRATDPAVVSELRRQSAALEAEVFEAHGQFRRAWTPDVREALRARLTSG